MAVGHQDFTQKKPDQLVYLELGAGNGGMLLSISAEGFRFRAVSAVHESGNIPFAFSLDGRNRLEGAGSIEWVEEDGKSGGMRFSEVSPEFRATLGQWLNSAPAQHTGREATPAASAPLDSMEKIREDLRSSYPARPASLSKVPERKAEGRVPAAAASDKKLTEKPVAGKTPAGKSPEKIAEAAKAKRTIPESAPDEIFEKKDPSAAPWPAPFSPGKLREPEKTASLSSAFLKPQSAPKGSAKPTAPGGADSPPAPAKRETPVFSSTSVLFGDQAGVSDRHAGETPRPFIPPLEESFEYAWEQAKLTAPPESPHLSRAAAGGIIAVALALIFAALAYNFRQDIGSIFIQLGQSISGENRQTAPAAAQEMKAESNPSEPPHPTASQPGASQATDSQHAPAESGSAANSPAGSRGGGSESNAALPGGPAATALRPSGTAGASGSKAGAGAAIMEKPAANPAAPVSRETAIDSTGGEEEFLVARDILHGGSRERDLPRAVELLWSSVKKGYVPAEVTLADLYRRGDGVEKNCVQARVLLVAASKKGSVEGREMLQKLLAQGCR